MMNHQRHPTSYTNLQVNDLVEVYEAGTDASDPHIRPRWDGLVEVYKPAEKHRTRGWSVLVRYSGSEWFQVFENDYDIYRVAGATPRDIGSILPK